MNTAITPPSETASIISNSHEACASRTGPPLCTANQLQSTLQRTETTSYTPDVKEQITTATPSGMNYSLPNARPPGIANINPGFERDVSYDMKYVNPPSYEEAIKGLELSSSDRGHHVYSENTDSWYYRGHPDNGQFATSEPYFHPHSYHESEFETETNKSYCAKFLSAMVIFGFAALIVRILFIVR